MTSRRHTLDINHQVELLRLLRTLNADSGKTIVVVLHDLNLACRFCDHVIAMADGRIVAEGAPIDVITPSSSARCSAWSASSCRTRSRGRR